MADQQPGSAPPASRHRLARGWVLFGEIVVVLAGVTTVLAYALPRGGGPPATRRDALPVLAAPTAGGSSVPPTGSGSGPAEPAALPLTALTPSEGGIYLSRSSSRSALVLRCPSNRSGDQSRVVSYDVRGQYRGLQADVRVSGAPTPPGRSTLEVLADDVRVGFVDITGNGSRPVTAELARALPGADPRPAQRLTLRITCQLTGPTITLLGPRLTP